MATKRIDDKVGIETNISSNYSYVIESISRYSQGNASDGFVGYPDRRQPLPSNQYEYKYPQKAPEQPQQHTVYHGNANLQHNGGEQQLPYYNQNDLWNRYDIIEFYFITY